MKYKRPETKNKLGRCGANGKVIFRTEAAAKKRVKEILAEETLRNNRCGYMRAFHCFRCGFWHLTSAPSDKYYKEHIKDPFAHESTRDDRQETKQAVNALFKEPMPESKVIQEHDEIMIAIGQCPEGDGSEHGEIMREIMGY